VKNILVKKFCLVEGICPLSTRSVPFLGVCVNERKILCDLAQFNWRLLLAAHDLPCITSSKREFMVGMMR